jgi:Uncharacterised nucleotidyltransferase
LKPVRWAENRAIPRCVTAALASLQFSSREQDWPAASESEWKAALYYCDRNQLTLYLRSRVRAPDEIGRRLDANLAGNRERIRRVKQAYWEVSGALQAANIEFVALKGFANWERFTADPAARLQYDLDLFCPHEAGAARDALTRLGYESIARAEQYPTDHLPALIRKTGWQWRGDFFDPEIPISVELHFRLWDGITEAFPAPGVEEFWARRVEQRLDGRSYLALDPVDALGYTSLHLLRHLLRGDVRASNIYELAYFLEQNAANDAFWMRWRNLHRSELRRLQALCFRLAAAWFDCRLSPIARAEVDLLSPQIRRWFENCAASPAEAFFRPNKDELWLHLCLLDSFRNKSAVLRRRLLPARLPGPLDSVFIPAERMTWQMRLRKRWQYARYVAGRAIFHARALLPTLSRILMTRS